MHDQDRLGPRRDLAFHLQGIDVPGVGVDVGEDRPGPGAANGADGGEEGEGGGDDLVAGTDVEGRQGQRQGIGTGGTADAVAGAAITGDLLFQGGHLRAENDLSGPKHPQGGLFQFRPQATIECLQIAKRNARSVHGADSFPLREGPGFAGGPASAPPSGRPGPPRWRRTWPHPRGIVEK